MHIDPSGYLQKWISSISQWLNEKHDSEMPENDSSNPLFINSISSMLGATGTKLINYYDKVSSYNINSPSGIYGRVLGTAGVIISIGGLVLDVSNTWTADNSNTNGDRLIKTLLQIMKFTFEYTATSYLIGIAVAVIGTGFMPVFIPVVALIGVYIISNLVYEKTCDLLEIE